MVNFAAMLTAGVPDHHPSHRDLLWTPEASAGHVAQVDAIVVPTVRPPAYLLDAATAAMALDCPLITLHSGKWTSAREAAGRLPPEVNLIAIDLADPERLRLPPLGTSRLLAGTRFATRTDTSAKRNVGLILARMADWRRVIFLDDDIVVRDPDHLRQAAGLLEPYNIVGLSVGGFPDNSVVCHAYRAVGGEQQSFIGGGALAVAVKRACSFFPNVYNDDWFYLLDAAQKGLQPSAVVGQVEQRPYDPFRTPDRARCEELGDVLAEGAFWLLDQGKPLTDADLRYWEDFLARRKRFVRRVLGRVSEAPIEPAQRARMEAALRASLGRLEFITADICRDYLRAWAADRERWRKFIDRQPTRLPLERALELLAGPHRDRLTWVTRAPVSAGVPGRAGRVPAQVS